MSLILLHRGHENSGTPLVLLHDATGTVYPYTSLKGQERNVYGISNPYFTTQSSWNSLYEQSLCYAELIRQALPAGDFMLGGWSYGGHLCLQVACILYGFQHRAAGIVMIDTAYPQTDMFGNAITFPIPRMKGVSSLTKVRLQKCFDETVELLRSWDIPLPSEFPLPPAILIRALHKTQGDCAPQTKLLVDHSRASEALGWDSYSNTFIKKTFNIDTCHFAMFDENSIDSVSDSLKVACTFLSK